MPRLRSLLVAVSLAALVSVGIAGPALGSASLPCPATKAYLEHMIDTPAADHVVPCII